MSERPLITRGVRGPQSDDPERHWIPARHVGRGVSCSFCGNSIPPAKPGTTTGTRGTKAFWNQLTHEWECIGCREAAMPAYYPA